MWTSRQRFKNQSVDDAVSTILVTHVDKDFVGAQPSPATADDTIINTKDAMCRKIENDLLLSYSTGEELDIQSKSRPCPATSLFLPIS